MILHWQQLLLHYAGDYDRDQLNAHRGLLERAGETTYAVLLCKWTPRGDRRRPSYHGVHAEQRLLQTPMWTEQIPNALQEWFEMKPGGIVITMALNRTPCGECADKLAQALHKLEMRFPARVPNARFICATRGYYQGNFVTSAGIRRDRVTTDKGLERMREAGWELCVLQFNGALPDRGRELLEYLQSRPGHRSLVARLGD